MTRWKHRLLPLHVSDLRLKEKPSFLSFCFSWTVIKIKLKATRSNFSFHYLSISEGSRVLWGFKTSFSWSLNTKHPLKLEDVCFWFQPRGNQTHPQKDPLLLPEPSISFCSSLLLSAGTQSSFYSDTPVSPPFIGLTQILPERYPVLFFSDFSLSFAW